MMRKRPKKKLRRQVDGCDIGGLSKMPGAKVAYTIFFKGHTGGRETRTKEQRKKLELIDPRFDLQGWRRSGEMLKSRKSKCPARLLWCRVGVCRPQYVEDAQEVEGQAKGRS